MSINTIDLTRWNLISSGLGAISWVCIVVLSAFGWGALNALDLILLLALCVLTPLAIPLAISSKEHQPLCKLYRLIILLQPVATLSGGVSLLLSTGPLAAAAAMLWLLFTGLIALPGMGRLQKIGSTPLPDICLLIALISLPIGGIWLVLARLGEQLLGFGQQKELLTAIHFHWISLVALLVTGLTGHSIQASMGAALQTLYRVAAWGVLINPLLVAAGITLTQVTGKDFLESTAATLLALSVILIALLSLRLLLPATASRLAKGMLLASNSAVFFTMLLAGAYALGSATGAWTITTTQMIAIHGWTNALVFGLCGLLGWRLRSAAPEG